MIFMHKDFQGSMRYIHRSLSKSLPLNNRVILLGTYVVFTDSCSGDSGGFIIVVVEMMEKALGDRGTVCLISKFIPSTFSL